MAIKSLIKNVLRKMQKQIPVQIPVLQEDLLKGRIAFITGGTSGIGLAIAKTFMMNGASVVIITGRDSKKIEKAVSEVSKYGTGTCQGYVLDVLPIKSLQDSIDRIIEDAGVIPDILVNNAGTLGTGGIMSTTPDAFEKTLLINTSAPYFVSQALVKIWISHKDAREKNILNIASSSSYRPAANPYAISKWGVRGMTRGLAKALLSHGIVVNGIAPGPTATPMLQGNSEPTLDSCSVPAGRMVAPEEVANLATFLVSSMGRMIVGETIPITGGAGTLTFDDLSYRI